MVENDVLETKTKKKERDIRSHLLALFSMSLSRLRNSSMPERLLREPHPLLVMKSTGLVVFEVVGNRRRKSNSSGLISLFISKIWKAIWAVKISLSHSNRPLKGGRFFKTASV